METLCGALTSRAFGYGFAGRLQQERGLYKTAIEIAERHELTSDLVQAQTNLGESLAQTDSPEADEATMAALTAARRIGDRSFECYCVGNLIYRRLLTGDWAEIDELAQGILGAADDEPLEGHFLHLRLAHLKALRGEVAAATKHLDRLDGLRASEDFEAVALCQAADASRAERGPARLRARAGARGSRPNREAGGAHEAIRTAWPIAVEAAIALERTESAKSLLDAMDRRPPGQLPPFLRAELHRNRGLLAAARDHQDSVERDLTAAMREYDALRYPYLLGRCQADLGAWLIDRGRRDEAQAPLESAAETFARLGAAPTRERVSLLLASDDMAAGAPPMERSRR